MRSLKFLALLLVGGVSFLQCSTDVTGPGSSPQSGTELAGSTTEYSGGLPATLGAAHPMPEFPEPYLVEGVEHFPIFPRRGDLIFCEYRPWFGAEHPGAHQEGFDHVALYIGSGMCIEAFRFAQHPGVHLVSLVVLRARAYLTFGRVQYEFTCQREDAIEFALVQCGDPYQDRADWECVNHDPYDPDDPWSDRWYDSELIWAAWYNQGIDLSNGKVGPPPYGCVYVSPQDLADDDDVGPADQGLEMEPVEGEDYPLD